MFEESIATLHEPYFLVKAYCRFSRVNGNFIQLMGALGEEFPTNSLPRKLFADEQQGQMASSLKRNKANDNLVPQRDSRFLATQDSAF